MKDWQRKILENYPNGEAPFFRLMKEQKPDKVENPKVEWTSKEPTITIDEWLFVGIDIDEQEIWINKNTKKIFKGNLN